MKYYEHRGYGTVNLLSKDPDTLAESHWDPKTTSWEPISSSSIADWMTEASVDIEQVTKGKAKHDFPDATFEK